MTNPAGCGQVSRPKASASASPPPDVRGDRDRFARWICSDTCSTIFERRRRRPQRLTAAALRVSGVAGRGKSPAPWGRSAVSTLKLFRHLGIFDCTSWRALVQSINSFQRTRQVLVGADDGDKLADIEPGLKRTISADRIEQERRHLARKLFRNLTRNFHWIDRSGS